MPVDTRKAWAKALQARHHISIRLSCTISGLSRSAYYYVAQPSYDEDIALQLTQLTQRHQRWGFPKCYQRLRSLGYKWNHKRVYRVYTALKLNFRSLVRQRLPARNPQPLAAPNEFGHTWSMDFMSDSLENKVRFRTLNVIDDANRELLGIHVSVGIPAQQVVRYLDQLAAWHGYPKRIRTDNGSEFCSVAFTAWADKHGITLEYTQPGRPYQNGYIERFNRTYRQEVLDLYWFRDINEVQTITDQWAVVYNTERPHDSLRNITPIAYKNTYLQSTS